MVYTFDCGPWPAQRERPTDKEDFTFNHRPAQKTRIVDVAAGNNKIYPLKTNA